MLPLSEEPDFRLACSSAFSSELHLALHRHSRYAGPMNNSDVLKMYRTSMGPRTVLVGVGVRDFRAKKDNLR